MRSRLATLASIAGLLVATSASAGHHLWDTTEIFSNASGSVQFIELFTAENNEAGLGPFTLKSGANTFTFVTNLSTTATANTWVLVATPGFAALPGAVTPDYTMPANFFSTAGGFINYAGVDIWNYGTVPTNGINSLLRNGTSAGNSPTNFAHQTGHINVATPVPSLQTWGLIALVGGILVLASGLLRKRANDLATA
ncbi:MAG: hypothetical protein HOP12_11035 [Candidatus Eisenbacteria bacterium]|uniref:IPTL-CTERM sorting domain-containing protein n=1 Tax=Eiseniibacteriota bacterium TaxID=2212470 RepID=A0A849SG10_UNCEI|nr:hypothetical protein [Candidatus Eisenbacteria bacterium]